LITAAIYFFGRDVIEKKFPNTVTSIQYMQNPPFISLGEGRFPFAFGIQRYEDWLHYIDESVYQFEIIYTMVD
jgi:hypothetical protein